LTIKYREMRCEGRDSRHYKKGGGSMFFGTRWFRARYNDARGTNNLYKAFEEYLDMEEEGLENENEAHEEGEARD